MFDGGSKFWQAPRMNNAQIHQKLMIYVNDPNYIGLPLGLPKKKNDYCMCGGFVQARPNTGAAHLGIASQVLAPIHADDSRLLVWKMR